MPQRRNHTKSMFGCDQCKKRRVKCDEKHPECASCAMREEECHYSKSRHLITAFRNHQGQHPNSSIPLQLALSSTTTTPRSDTSSTSTSTSPAPSHLPFELQQRPDEFTSSTRKRELELMHFWFTKTSQSFTADLRELFQIDVVEMALEHEYLYDFIFALTALHIASEKAESASASDAAVMPKYVNIALRYQSNGFPKFRTALNSITEENCSAIFFSSVLAMICSMASHFFVSEREDAGGITSRSQSPAASCILSLYRFIEGIQSVHVISRHWLERGPYKLITQRRTGSQVLLSESAMIASAQLRQLNSVVNTDAKRPNSPRYQMYENTIQFMESSFEKNLGMTWVNFAGEDFVNELLKEEPMALAILMHWGVILCKMDQIWWAVLLGRRLAEDVCEILAGHGGQFDEVRVWARLELG